MKNTKITILLSFLTIFTLALQSCKDRFERVFPDGNLIVTSVRVDFINFFDENNQKWDVDDDSGPEVIFTLGEYNASSNTVSLVYASEAREVNSSAELPYTIDVSNAQIILNNRDLYFALFDGDGDFTNFNTNTPITEAIINPINNGVGRFEVDPNTGKGEEQITNTRGDAFTIFYEEVQ